MSRRRSGTSRGGACSIWAADGGRYSRTCARAGPRGSGSRCRRRRMRPAAVTASRVPLSAARAKPFRRNGLEVHVRDARTVTGETFGPFDALASLGAFEHFCSVDDYLAGRQGDVYRSLFANWATALPRGGRLYLQTMVFGRNMIPYDEVSIDAPRDSDGWIMALMGRQFPGSWLPFGYEQIERTASPDFKLLSRESGRLDYIETIKQWRKRFGEPSLRKALLKARLVPKWLTSRDFL